MFDPAALREDLLMFALVVVDNGAVVVEQHEARAGRAGVDCAYVRGHTLCTLPR